MHRAAADTAAYWDAIWDSDPPRHAPSERLTRWYRDICERHLPKDGLIVEAGCGNGNIMRTFARGGWTIEGLDFAERTVRANLAIDPRGRYRIGDVRALPYEDGQLAGYISLGVVEHFSDEVRAAILQECARCLRVGGVAMITTPYFSPFRRAQARMGGFDSSVEDLPFYQYFFTRRDLCEQIEAAGMRVIETDAYDIYKGLKDTVGWPGLKRSLEWFKARGPGCARMLHHPPKALRLLCGHMQLVMARKERSAGHDAQRQSSCSLGR
ncbi:MAG TPA: class I SAM-dependent methyltransferase [Phycisphaerales bacterium]|nr:class I SAM-dependent methyltransferase [Phycisphaerales bacterium]